MTWVGKSPTSDEYAEILVPAGLAKRYADAVDQMPAMDAPFVDESAASIDAPWVGWVGSRIETGLRLLLEAYR